MFPKRNREHNRKGTMTDIKEISYSIQSGDTRQAIDLVNQAIMDKCQPLSILREGLVAGMMETEKRFLKNEILDSEVLIAEQTMNAGLDILRPVLEAAREPPLGTVIIGTPEGDIRETEKNIISIMMQNIGLKVKDLGVNVSNIRFIEAALEEKAHIIVCTTSLTTFLSRMKSLVQAADQANIRPKTKLLLTGRPVTEWFCKSIDADLYAPDPVQTAEVAVEYCRKKHR